MIIAVFAYCQGACLPLCISDIPDNLVGWRKIISNSWHCQKKSPVSENPALMCAGAGRARCKPDHISKTIFWQHIFWQEVHTFSISASKRIVLKRIVSYLLSVPSLIRLFSLSLFFKTTTTIKNYSLKNKNEEHFLPLNFWPFIPVCWMIFDIISD